MPGSRCFAIIRTLHEPSGNRLRSFFLNFHVLLRFFACFVSLLSDHESDSAEQGNKGTIIAPGTIRNKDFPGTAVWPRLLLASTVFAPREKPITIHLVWRSSPSRTHKDHQLYLESFRNSPASSQTRLKINKQSTSRNTKQREEPRFTRDLGYHNRTTLNNPCAERPSAPTVIL